MDNKLRREVEEAKMVRGLFSGSDHFAVVAKVRIRERWDFKGNGKKRLVRGSKEKQMKILVGSYQQSMWKTRIYSGKKSEGNGREKE